MSVNANENGPRRLDARRGTLLPGLLTGGRTIAFFSSTKIYLMNADGSEHRTLTKLSDGRKHSLRGGPTGRSAPSWRWGGCGDFLLSRLYVVNSDGSGLRNLNQSRPATVILVMVPRPILPGRPTGRSSPSCDSTPATGLRSTS